MKDRRGAALAVATPWFPGEIAGASLKGHWRADGRRAEGVFPGEIAGASLKGFRARGQGRAGGRFPGEIAGASLKARACSTAPEPRIAGFPGEIAGASLKGYREGLHVVGSHSSPAKSPGPH